MDEGAAADRPFCAVAASALPDELFARVSADLDSIIAIHEEASPDVAGSAASLTSGSFWVALDELGPANAIEEAARHLARNSAALRSVLCGVKARGFEWWWQEHEPEEAPKGLHTDKCAALLPLDGEQCVREAHPVVSSVLYLSAEGGPTVLFDQTLERPSGAGAEGAAAEPRPAAPAQALVCAPAENRMLLFDGRLLHGVLHRPGGPAAGLRRTLLINWWAERPPGVADAPRRFALGRPARAPAGAAAATERPERPGPVPLAQHGSAAVRFCADARSHWAAQRLPPELSAAYASCLTAGKAPLLLALYDALAGTAGPVGHTPGRGHAAGVQHASQHDVPAAVVAARRGQAAPGVDGAVARELRELWPPY